MLNSCHLDNFVAIKNVKTCGGRFYSSVNRRIDMRVIDLYLGG